MSDKADMPELIKCPICNEGRLIQYRICNKCESEVATADDVNANSGKYILVSTVNKQIEEYISLLRDMDVYLSVSKHEQIGAGSIFHKQIKQLIKKKYEAD